jgi:hypothetical protein
MPHECPESAVAILNRMFEELTGPVRNPPTGETYAARALLYLDCGRDGLRPSLSRVGA